MKKAAVRNPCETTIDDRLIRQILSDILKENQKIPNAFSISILSATLDTLRLKCYFEQKFKFREFLNHYMDCDQKHHLKEFLKYDRGLSRNLIDSEVIEPMADLARAIERLENALVRTDAEGKELDRLSIAGHDNWHALCAAVATQFIYAMKRQTFGVSNDGPVPRFVSAIVPYITGEQPTVAAVGKRLKDIARTTKQGRDSHG